MNKESKIVCFCDYFLPSVGGIQYSTLTTLYALSERGMEVVLYAPKYQNDHLVDSKLPFKVIRMGNVSYQDSIKRLLNGRKLFSGSHAFLIMGHYHEIAYGFLTHFLSLRWNILAAGTRLEHSASGLKRIIRNYLIKHAYTRSQKLLVISQNTIDTILRHVTISLEKFAKIPRPIDEDIWYPSERAPQALYFNLVTATRLDLEKNVQGVLEIVKLLIDLKYPVKYKIIGAGTYKENLIRKIEELQLTEHVELLGELSPEEMRKVFSESQLHILLSLYDESFGRCYIEAAACAVPSIGYETGGTIETIVNGVNGYRFKKGEVEPIAACLEKIIKDKDFHERLKASSRDFYLSHFTKKRVGELIAKNIAISG